MVFADFTSQPLLPASQKTGSTVLRLFSLPSLIFNAPALISAGGKAGETGAPVFYDAATEAYRGVCEKRARNFSRMLGCARGINARFPLFPDPISYPPRHCRWDL